MKTSSLLLTPSTTLIHDATSLICLDFLYLILEPIYMQLLVESALKVHVVVLGMNNTSMTTSTGVAAAEEDVLCHKFTCSQTTTVVGVPSLLTCSDPDILQNTSDF